MPTCHLCPTTPPSHSFLFRAHCFKRNGWRSSLYVSVSFSYVRCHVKFDAHAPALRILLPWLLSIRLPLFSMPVFTRRLFNSHTQSFTVPPNLGSGLSIPSGLVSSPPVFGSSPTNAVTRPTPSPSLSTMPSVGSFTLGVYLYRPFSPIRLH